MAVISEYPLHNTGQEVQTAIDDALETLPYQIALKANKSDVLSKTNTDPYTPTGDYNPATKLYVESIIKPTTEIGATITGEPGTEALVTNSGTNRDAILNFTIPRGDKGEKGNTGDAAGFDTPTASVETLSPGSDATVSVTASGLDTAKQFDFQFGIPRGIQGFYTNSIRKTSGTGAAGTTDVYTLYLNDADSTSIGTISVYNGADGTGSGTVTSVGIGSPDNTLTISDSPITSNGTIQISHTNNITAQDTLALYPVKIDSSGHISEVGEAFDAGDMKKTTYDTNNNGIVDGAETLHNSDIQLWFSVD